ncbi:hypothetical protein LOTGIDRAFT_166550 [Lottia gigantea]|uniref:Uncharacterized protein n=1 Tax=Lottia gigantea TaxID=225164 RepID=V3Z937_LOTGI|nr:hypothetical protein LOTGIDRAFT_166550 [Lottia gigantea]ESO87403.1 hypothetical protein LOTGIDRAFT_166550 [Lottia gigantea]
MYQHQLLNIGTERRKAVIRKQIAENRTRINALSQLTPATWNPTANPGTTPVPAVQQGEQITEPLCQNPIGGILVDLDTTKPDKLLQIINFLRLDPVGVNTYSFGDGLEFRIGQKRSLENVSVEELGYANTRILQELMKLDPEFNPNPYLKYTAYIFRLAGKYVWYSVLLYDKEYRERQTVEKFEWGACLQDLREFQLKKDHPTALALQEQNLAHNNTKPVGYGKPSSNSYPISVRRKGPFTSEGG